MTFPAQHSMLRVLQQQYWLGLEHASKLGLDESLKPTLASIYTQPTSILGPGQPTSMQTVLHLGQKMTSCIPRRVAWSSKLSHFSTSSLLSSTPSCCMLAQVRCIVSMLCISDHLLVGEWRLGNWWIGGFQWKFGMLMRSFCPYQFSRNMDDVTAA